MAPEIRNLPFASEDIFQHRPSVLGLRVNGKVGLDPKMHAMQTQGIRTKAVKSANVRTPFESGHEGRYTVCHFAGRSVGEGQCENSEVFSLRRIKYSRDATSQHARLACTWAGQYEQGAIVPVDGATLDSSEPI